MLLRGAPWRAPLGLAVGGWLLGGLGLALGGGSGVRVLQLAWLLLAGAAALTLDEPAAAAVDACPVTRARQLASRAALAAVPVLGGLLLLGGHPWAGPLALQLVGTTAVAFTAAALLRHRLDAPGEPVCAALVLAMVVLVGYDPVAERLPLYRGTLTGTTLWGVLLTLSTVALLIATRPRRWRTG